MSTPALDLHCDLLVYLASGERRRPWDPLARASLPLLRRGGVESQVLAVFSWVHDGSVELGRRQLEAFEQIERFSSGTGRPLRGGEPIGRRSRGAVRLLLALESGATFATEDEPLDRALERLGTILDRGYPLLYLSLTWNEENRFGGGNTTDVGLKGDGRELLDFLSGRSVAIDFSHTSDALAEGILEHIDRRGLDLAVMASHSGLRAVHDVPRNLPDPIATEIARRGGLIGVNFLSKFTTPDGPSGVLDHYAHGLTLGAERALALGADYFATVDIPPDAAVVDPFHDELRDGSCYPWLETRMRERFGREFVEAVWHRNAVRFIDDLWA